VAAEFRQSLAETKQCAEDPSKDFCQCYSTMVIAQWGQVCGEDQTMRAELKSVCEVVRKCQDAGIQNVCDTILPSTGANLIWLWGALGGLGGLMLVATGYRFRSVLKRATGSKLRQGG
jgi:hypothetical protein